MKITRTPLIRALALLVCILTLAGCGIRLETPAPGPLVPGATETARQAAVNDVSEISHLAAALLETLNDEDQDFDVSDKQREALVEFLAVVTEASHAHYRELGEDYVSGLDDTATPIPEDSTAPAPEVVTPDELLTKLTNSYLRTRASLPLIPDAPLSRLLAAVSLSQLLLADELAKITGLPAPVIPAQTTAAAPVEDDEEAAEDIDATITSVPAPTLHPAGPVVSESLVPFELPEGLGAESLSAVVADEDNVGYLLELRTAFAPDAEREATRLAASTHRDRAERWAVMSEISRTAEDPRLLHYGLSQPLSQTDEAADRLGLIDADLAVLFHSLVAHYVYLGFLVEGEDRVILHDLAADSALNSAAYGSPRETFPGLAEQ